MSATSPARNSAHHPDADAGGALLALTGALDGAAADEICPRAAYVLREAVHADLAVVLRGGELAAATGADLCPDAVAELRGACEHGADRVTLPALGEVRLVSARLDGPVSWLIAARRAAAFPAPAATVVPAAAQILSLHLRVARASETTATLRRRGERETRQRKRAERELAHRALHDELTGLANRAHVRERAKLALDQARTGHLAVLFVDVDNFKLANDALDHRRGDRLLIALAQRLTSVLSLEDGGGGRRTLARPGGDEFIVLCEALETERDAVAVAQRIQDALRAPFFVDGVPVTVTASIGIAIAAAGQTHDADQVLRDADVALSRAKERGRDRYEIFDAPMRVRLLDRVAFEGDLRTAIETGQLRLHYQPVVTVTDGTLAAVEALVRWQHPTRGLLGPGEFVPLAEEGDLIVALGAWVIEEACAQIRRWREAHPAHLGVRVSVNVSARQLSPQLIETVTAALQANDVSPSSLALEITESLVVEHTDSAREVLAELEQLGVAIVLDDFGTGYSSLSYLASFHVSQLKLDRSFVADLSRDARAAKIIAATIDLARALGMTVVAEGVETAEQVAVLRRLGCDFAQGFHYARPTPADAILERMRAAYEGDREIAARPATRTVEAPPRVADAHSSHRRQQVAIGRLAGWLFLAGSVVALPSDLLLGSPGPGLTAALTLMGLVSALICLRVPWQRASDWGLCAAGMLATLEITTSVVAVGQHGLVLEPIYLLVATTTAYAFRDRRMIAGQIVFIVGAMTFGLLMHPTAGPGAVSFTLVMILVLIVMSALIAYLRELLEGGAAELRELAASDPLTGVGNYRRLHERLEYELLRHQRDGGKLSLLLIDLDCFKQVNERRGHAAGDDVLRRVAATLRESVRSQDTVARQGGDEFAVLAPETDLEGAAMLAARIRDRLGRVQFAGDSIGATVGWAVYPADGRTAAELLARADERLMTRKLAPEPAPAAIAGTVAGSAMGTVLGPAQGAGTRPST